jgi:large subunit ribosomal protein L21
MYAIIVSGGKQYKAEKDLIIRVEKLDANAGDKLKFDVLLLSDEGKITFGSPFVEAAYCEAEVLGHGKGDKLLIYRYKAKKNVRKKKGHRQLYTAVKITNIVG